MPVDSATVVQPTIFVQDFRSGDSCTGAAYTGTATVLRRDASFPALDGRVHRASPAAGDATIDGGLVNLAVLAGGVYNRVSQAWVSLPGCGSVELRVVNPAGAEFLVKRSEDSTLVLSQIEGVLILPGWSVTVVGDSILTDTGSVTIITEQWAQPCALVR